MKFIFYSIIIITIAGCTTTYKLSGSRSSEKFYENLKNAIETRSVNVNLVNDSSIFTSDKNTLISDTLYSFKEINEARQYKIPTVELLNIDYKTNDYKTANLSLKNGEKLRAENLSMGNDTAYFLGIKTFLRQKMIAPLSDIKSVEYKNHWKGVIPGILGGTLLGGVLGATGWIIHPMNGGNHETFDSYSATYFGAVSGLIMGAVVGYIIGFDINYQFY